MNTFLGKTALIFGALDVLKALTRGHSVWRKRILDYNGLVENIISLEHNFQNESSFWILLFNISQWKGLLSAFLCCFSNILKGAKILLPQKILDIVRGGSKANRHYLCADIYALLCNEESIDDLLVSVQSLR